MHHVARPAPIARFHRYQVCRISHRAIGSYGGASAHPMRQWCELPNEMTARSQNALPCFAGGPHNSLCVVCWLCSCNAVSGAIFLWVSGDVTRTNGCPSHKLGHRTSIQSCITDAPLARPTDPELKQWSNFRAPVRDEVGLVLQKRERFRGRCLTRTTMVFLLLQYQPKYKSYENQAS